MHTAHYDATYFWLFVEGFQFLSAQGDLPWGLSSSWCVAVPRTLNMQF